MVWIGVEILVLEGAWIGSPSTSKPPIQVTWREADSCPSARPGLSRRPGEVIPSPPSGAPSVESGCRVSLVPRSFGALKENQRETEDILGGPTFRKTPNEFFTDGSGGFQGLGIK